MRAKKRIQVYNKNKNEMENINYARVYNQALQEVIRRLEKIKAD